MILSQQVGQYPEFGVRTGVEDFLSHRRFAGLIVVIPKVCSESAFFAMWVIRYGE